MSFAGIFDGMRPRWAVEALERLMIAGLVREDDEGALTITTTGHDRLAEMKTAQRRKVWDMPPE